MRARLDVLGQNHLGVFDGVEDQILIGHNATPQNRDSRWGTNFRSPWRCGFMSRGLGGHGNVLPLIPNPDQQRLHHLPWSSRDLSTPKLVPPLIGQTRVSSAAKSSLYWQIVAK